MSYKPTTKNRLYDKFLSISALVENAKIKISYGYLAKARDYLDQADKTAREGMEILRSIPDERNMWHE